MRALVVPDWLAEVVRPKPAPVPWPQMIRAALAICVPLSVTFALGNPALGVLPAMGGLLGTLADTGGPYLSRVKRVCSAAVFGGVAGLAIGSAVHGHGWLAVVAMVVVAGVSGVLSAFGDIGSVTGLQLLVYTSLGHRPDRGAAAGVAHGGGIPARRAVGADPDPPRLAAVALCPRAARRGRGVRRARGTAPRGRHRPGGGPAAGTDHRAQHRV